MTSFLEVIAHDEQDQARATRRAAAAYSAQVEDRFGVFFRTASSRAEFDDRVRYASDELAGLAHAAVNEYGGGDPQVLYSATLALYEPMQETVGKTASTVEAAGRKPRMCPFHKDVVDISLNAGDPAAGFNALQSQWGGARHCEGDGYEGDKCNFKPAMTTQSFWDDKAQKAQERRELREQQQAELDESQGFEEVDVDEAADSVPDDAPVQNETPEAEGAEIIDFPTNSAESEGADVPMSMAASTAGFQAVASPTTGLGGPAPKMDKRKWTPQTVPALEGLDSDTGRHPTERQDILVPGLGNPATNDQPLKQIGEKGALEHQELTTMADGDDDAETHKKTLDQSGQGGTWTQGPGSAVTSADHVTPRCPNCGSGTTGMLDDSGEQGRCHACGAIFEPGAVPEKLGAYDVNKNPIIDMMNGDYDGFVPDHVAARAILAHKQR